MCSTSIYFTIVSGLFSILAVSAQFIPQNSKSTFEFQNEVLLSDSRSTPYRSGYRISSELTVSSVWSNDIQQLYYFELNPLKLETKSGDTRKDLKFKKRISSLDKKPKQEFYALFEVGKVVKFLTDDDQDISILNLKRGIVSLFQFDMNQNPNHEHDISGQCTVFYKAKSSTKYKKTKTDCNNWSLIVNKRKEIPLGISIGSLHETDYELAQDSSLSKLVSVEVHSIAAEAKPDVGNHIQSTMTLKHLSSAPVDQLKGADEEQVLSNLKKYKLLSLDADVDGAIELFKAALKQGIKNSKSKLRDDKIGTSELALTIANLVPVTRISHKEELVKILKSQTAQEIKYQLIDLLAAAQTEDAHSAVTEIWKFDNDDHFSYLERYLQSLSIGTRPKEEIIQDLYGKVSFTQWKNDKLKDTTIQTLCALVSKYASITPDEYNHSLLEDVKKLLLLQLAKCETHECRVMYVRGFENLEDPSTISILMKLVKEDAQVVSVAAMKALKAFPVKHFSINERKDFEKIFYQTAKKYDSSTRILALDILLELDNDGKQLMQLLKYLTSSDKAFEVKTYLLQKIQMLCTKYPRFAGLVYQVLEDNPEIRNYHVVAQKGLTTALERTLSGFPAFNESLLSIQETNNGVLKMGIVDILLKSGEHETSIFKLGLFTSGLAAFVGGGSKDEDEKEEKTEEEPVTAGMQIAVQGVNFRPLVFFNGQSELMGHVWSGTASEPTPAYQATTLLQDHEEFLILQNGMTIYFRVLGAKSIDLNGQIQTSIWNRNAHVEINQNTGVALTGLLVARSSYVTLQNEFVVAGEPKIGLTADVDFYSDLMLCLQLTRPAFKLWHQVNKTLSIEETKYSSKNSVNATYSLPGNTLALNRKNNQMCSKIFA